MAEFPAMPLWTDAYLADTRHLSTEEHGAYLLLLMESWRRPSCDLPDDDEILARLAGLSEGRWESVKPVVMAFFKRDGRSKTWSQKRLKKERMYVADVRAKKRSAAATRWNEKKKADAYALQMQSTHTHTHTLEKEEPKGSSKKRGSRLPADWSLPQSWGAWALSQGLDELAVRREADKFADYWRGKAGKDAVKLDWKATWRNWVRNALERRPQGGRQAPSQIGEQRKTADGRTLEWAGAVDGWMEVRE